MQILNRAPERLLAAAVLSILAISSAAAEDRAPIAAAEPVAAAPDVSFVLGRVRARPGETVELVLSVRTDAPIKSLSIALDFDESRVRALDFQRVPAADEAPILAPEDFASTTVSNADQEAGNQLREGWIHVQMEALNDLRELGIRSGAETPILKMTFLVLPRAEPGFTPVRFATVGPAGTVPSTWFVNRVETSDGTAAEPQAIPPEKLQDGGIEIIGEVGFFMRGDVNRDRRRDVSDPIVTLGFLFFSGVPVSCLDAVDSNDDGSLDLSDPIFTLGILFEEPLPFPAPGEWGPDPTPDGLDCIAY